MKRNILISLAIGLNVAAAIGAAINKNSQTLTTHITLAIVLLNMIEKPKQ